ncbi:MAG TPA: SDR family NAD-dependent epimerase/dehydratase, partial [Ottowia sp.]|nr:SDR family NAD-dependent epimerase/dehydratase [Ottowia sp.]
DNEQTVGPINLGNPQEVSMRTLAQEVLRLCGGSATVRQMPPRPEDPRCRRPDIGQANRLLGWRPRVSLEQGLRWTIDWFREQIG